MTSSLLLNPPIPQGICVAIVAPGGYAKDDAVIARGVATLEQLGCQVKLYLSDQPYQRFGGTDSERVTLLHQAALDPDVHIVMALRGGYGTSRLLDMIDWDVLTSSHKIFVGYSDITALHLALLAKKQYMSIAGPMLCSDFGCDIPHFFTQQHFWRLITQDCYSISVQTPAAEDNPEIAISGPIWGGNLAMVAHLAGTPYLPNIADGILFVEDINEHPYRVERMLLQLHYSGVLEKQQALVLGQFTDYRLSDYDNGYDFNAMLTYLRQKIHIPILTGLPFGHTPERISIPVGAQATLVSDQDGYVLTFSHYPKLTV